MARSTQHPRALPEGDLVTAAEAARRLGVSRQTIGRWYQAKHFRMVASRPHPLTGHSTALYRWADVQACAVERRANAERYCTPAPKP